MNGLYLNGSSERIFEKFVASILEIANRFERTFRDLILHRLALSFSLVHQSNFITQRRRLETENEQRMNDRLFQRSIKLKDWCRIKIREHTSLGDIPKLNLPNVLINYCSFDLYHPEYAVRCLKEVKQKQRSVRLFYSFRFVLGCGTWRKYQTNTSISSNSGSCIEC